MKVGNKHKKALKEILAIWQARECLHQCRWGKQTVEICTEALTLGKDKE
jgi:hypothetical protein